MKLLRLLLPKKDLSGQEKWQTKSMPEVVKSLDCDKIKVQTV